MWGIFLSLLLTTAVRFYARKKLQNNIWKICCKPTVKQNKYEPWWGLWLQKLTLEQYKKIQILIKNIIIFIINFSVFTSAFLLFLGKIKGFDFFIIVLAGFVLYFIYTTYLVNLFSNNISEMKKVDDKKYKEE